MIIGDNGSGRTAMDLSIINEEAAEEASFPAIYSWDLVHVLH